jgi:23S rRNA pseudouridine1911/1915/1917 synthase
MAHLGHPLLGDPVYGSGYRTKADKLARTAPAAGAALEALGRQALHARLLGFRHPSGRRKLRFESPLPADLQALVEALRSL